MELIASFLIVSLFIFLGLNGFYNDVKLKDKSASRLKRVFVKTSCYFTYSAYLVASFLIVINADLGFPWAPVLLMYAMGLRLIKTIFSWKTLEFRKPTLMHVITTNLTIIGGLMFLMIKGL